MARAAVPRGLSVARGWRRAVLVGRMAESATASTLLLDVDTWRGHLPGQHVDVRLTAADGYQAARSYSLAAPAAGTRLEITVQRTVDGEVSPFLVDEMRVGDAFEVRGPLGGWFVWHAADPGPVLLVGGGSGVVPLMAMVRARAVASNAPFRLLHSVRSPADRLYAVELERLAAPDSGLEVAHLYTRHAPEGSRRPARRISAEDVRSLGWPPDVAPTCFVCGPTPFVEVAAGLLAETGHAPDRIRTERFGNAS